MGRIGFASTIGAAAWLTVTAAWAVPRVPVPDVPMPGVTVSGVTLGSVNAQLLVPAHPHGAIVLMSGADGRIGVSPDGKIARQANFLVRTRKQFVAKGFAVLVPDAGVSVPAAVSLMTRYGAVTVVGTSRGTLRAAQGIAEGARPAKLVLTSSFLTNESGETENVANILGDPSRLPPTLLVHHRHDTCKHTQPAGVAPFLAWAKGKARVVWIDGGTSVGPDCEPYAHHGFNGVEQPAVDAIAAFAR